MEKLRVGFLVSGNGGSLRFVHQAALRLGLPLEVVLVLADRPCGALTYARAAGLPYQQLVYTRTKPAALQQALRETLPDVVVTNVHKILDASTLALLPGRFINLHYSLLPAFKGCIGMQTLELARQLNAAIVGATCHEVDEQVDSGRILAQVAMAVDWSRDTTADLHELIFRGACLVLLQELLQRASVPATGNHPTLSLLGRTVLFAPALRFSVEQLNEAFWQHVKVSSHDDLARGRLSPQ